MSSTLSLAAPQLRDRLEIHKEQHRLGIHSFHRYFGKLIPAIPSAAIEEFTKPGDTVMDPFCGSGTTLVEAIAKGRNAIGIDINPLSVLVAQAKTTRLNPVVLEQVAAEVIKIGKSIYEDNAPEPPYVVNIHHWYRPKVIKQLASLHKAVNSVTSKPHRQFLQGCLSAVNRNVSNADPQHVFPGYSKRLRQIDLEKGRKLDVFNTFASGVKKRIGYLSELVDVWQTNAVAEVFCDNSDNDIVASESVDLLITNPPYISSVRYLETLKLEMSWAGFIDSPDMYRDMDRLQYGSERFLAPEMANPMITGIRDVDLVAQRLFDKGEERMSLTVSTFFRRFKTALEAWDRALKPGAALLLKMSPSRIRDELINTPDILSSQLMKKGYQIIDRFHDEYNQNSRSLTTKRNYYSGRMDSDEIIVLVKP